MRRRWRPCRGRWVWMSDWELGGSQDEISYNLSEVGRSPSEISYGADQFGESA